MTTMTASVVQCEVCWKKNRVPAAGSGVPRCGKCHSPLPWIAEANDETFAEVAEAPAIAVVLDLWAPWCGPCRMVSPALESLARQYAGQIKLVKVNVDQAPQLSRRFEVRGIPTLLVLKEGKVVSRQKGAAPEHALKKWLDQALAGS